MFNFVLKGILRDRSRSLFPIIIVSIIVALVVFYKGFLVGAMGDMFRDSSVIETGHVKIMSEAYKREKQMMPNDLALLDVDDLIDELQSDYPNYLWTPRINFAGLLDLPDENGETQSQGPVFAKAIDFLSAESNQNSLWELKDRIISGRPIAHFDEILVSRRLANQLDIQLNDIATFIGTTMNNAFTTYNFKVVGMFDLGIGPLDKQMILADIQGARHALDMENAASEILGYELDLFYKDKEAQVLRDEFNHTHADSADPFHPAMIALRDQNQMGTMVDITGVATLIILGIFMGIAMIVLWNMGIMSGLRRYGEMGIRLAMGETKGQVYRSLILESVIIGTIGTLVGTAIGLPLTYYVQKVGIDYSDAFEQLGSNTIIMPTVFYTKVTPDLFFIGIIPGIIATVLGTMLAGRAIYKREMAQLFKELEN